MLIEIDFQSEEAIYMQLRNQIVLSIAASLIREGDTLPSVRQLAGDIGVAQSDIAAAGGEAQLAQGIKRADAGPCVLFF